jgi:hypothetical protein
MHTDVIAEQVAIAAIASWVLERLKNWESIPWFDQYSDQLNRLASICIAFGTSAGLTMSWDGNAQLGWKILVSIPSLQALIEFSLHAVFSFVSQEGVYRGMIKRPKE